MLGLRLGFFFGRIVSHFYVWGKSMSNTTLDEVSHKLNEQGVLDVKFVFKREALAVPQSDLAEDVAEVLSNFMAGKNKEVIAELPTEDLTPSC